MNCAFTYEHIRRLVLAPERPDNEVSPSGAIESVDFLLRVLRPSGAGTYLLALLGADTITSPPPRMGEHNREVLARLGYNEDEMRELERKGVI
jgi:hypothetical protein